MGSPQKRSMPSSVMSFHSLFAHLLTVNSNQSSQVYGVEMLEVGCSLANFSSLSGESNCRFFRSEGNAEETQCPVRSATTVHPFWSNNHAGTACSFTMPRAASRSATLHRFSRKSGRSSPGGSCGKAALFGIGRMPLLNPPGMLLRPDAEVFKKPTPICIPMPRSRSLEPVVFRFK